MFHSEFSHNKFLSYCCQCCSFCRCCRYDNINLHPHSDLLPIPRVGLYYLDIPQGMQAMALTDRQTDRITIIATQPAKRPLEFTPLGVIHFNVYLNNLLLGKFSLDPKLPV